MKARMKFLFAVISTMLITIGSLNAQTTKDEQPKPITYPGFRPYSLLSVYATTTFIHWDHESARDRNYSRSFEFVYGFQRTKQKKAMWGPSWEIAPFTGTRKYYVSEAGQQLMHDSLHFAQEKFKCYYASFSLFNRFAFISKGKTHRVKHPVLFLDLGISTQLPMLLKLIQESDSLGFGAKPIRTFQTLRKRPAAFGFARFGTTGISLFGQWQFTSHFRREGIYPEWPRLSAGFLVNIPLFHRPVKSPAQFSAK
jgi:hypothetical protein